MWCKLDQVFKDETNASARLVVKWIRTELRKMKGISRCPVIMQSRTYGLYQTREIARSGVGESCDCKILPSRMWCEIFQSLTELVHMCY